MKFIDTHLHLDERINGSAFDAVNFLDSELESAGIRRGVVLHLISQRWPMEEVGQALKSSRRLVGFVNIDPFGVQALKNLRLAVEEHGFVGLKLHPRLQNFRLDEPLVHKLVRFAGEMNVPVVIDAFPDGTFLQQEFNVLSYSRIAHACPNTRIIVAHMGGHYVLDFMMLAKRIPNLYFDTSYSLLYYRGSSVPQNMIYAMQSMKFERVFYGSDYPDRTISETLDSSLQEFKERNVSDEDIQKIFYQNAKEFFKWTDV
jgi:predicted TIM-barrel fold metal-dependent hydrolase